MRHSLGHNASWNAGYKAAREELESEKADLLAPGPCGKHPKMFYHVHGEGCFRKLPETEGIGDYMHCQLVAGCTLCTEQSALTAENGRLREALQRTDRCLQAELNGTSTESAEDIIVHNHILLTPKPLFATTGKQSEPPAELRGPSGVGTSKPADAPIKTEGQQEES